MTADVAVRAGRAALLDVLADLLLCELSLPLAEQLAADPALAAALQPPTTAERLVAVRAEYTDLFVFDLPPYSSVFLDVPPVIGGTAARRWEDVLGAVGLDVPPLERAAASDHGGLVLRALASAELADRAADLLPAALAWLPQWLTALRGDADESFYGRVAALTMAALGASVGAAAVPSLASATAAGPAVVTALPDERDLRTLSRWLCTPAESGWFLTKRQLRRLARSFGCGVGIVDRAQMLQQVLAASALDQRVDKALGTLRRTLHDWRTAEQEWRKVLGGWSTVLEPWVNRLAATDVLLSELLDAVPSGDMSEDALQ